MASVSKVRMWRWRASPLRRRSDVVEAWVLLVTVAMMVVGGTAVAVITFLGVQHTASQQRAEREQVRAVLTQDARSQGADTLYVAPNDEVASATVRWTGPDGTGHQGKAQVPENGKAGSSVPVWIDQQGHQVTAPPGNVMAGFQSTLCSMLAGGTLVALVLGLQQGVRISLDHRRAAEWERAWAEVEPRWRPRTP